MAEHKDCKKFAECGFRKELHNCPNSCVHFRHEDEVRVVRCKVCKHWKLNSCWRVHNQYACFGHNNNAPILNDFYPEDFCSYGERKAK